jgi:hypothetical protein
MYTKDHTEDHCDKCEKLVGKKNLHKMDFIYKDMNDKMHADLGDGYRQYYVCNECEHEEWKISFGAKSKPVKDSPDEIICD